MRAPQNDREIVRRVLRGDVDQFSHLVTSYSPRMLRLAFGLVRRRDTAEDVVQDSLVKAYEKLGSWRGDSSLSTWLYRIVYTTAVSSLRRTGRTDCDFFDLDTSVAAAVSDSDDDWSLTESNISRMRLAVESLSPLDRTLVTLFYLEDRSVRDVSLICGESETNVKTRLHRARTKLKKLMSNEL